MYSKNYNSWKTNERFGIICAKKSQKWVLSFEWNFIFEFVEWNFPSSKELLTLKYHWSLSKHEFFLLCGCSPHNLMTYFHKHTFRTSRENVVRSARKNWAVRKRSSSVEFRKLVWLPFKSIDYLSKYKVVRR